MVKSENIRDISSEETIMEKHPNNDRKIEGSNPSSSVLSASEEIENFKRKLLEERLAMVSPTQREFFYKLYPKKISSKDLETAIDLCGRTIKCNIKNPERMLK